MLFKQTSDIKPHYPVGLTTELDKLQGTIDEVEREILIESILGEQQYNELHTAYHANTMTPEQAALLPLCQAPVARLALHRFTPEANVDFSAGGLTVGKTDHVVPASEWRTRDVERRLLHSGYRAIDVLIGYLIQHQNDFIFWQISPQYTAMNSGFVRRTSEFDGVVGIGNSHWYFTSLLPIIRRVEQTIIAEVLCHPNVVAAIDVPDLSTLSFTHADVRQHIIRCVPHFAMADAIKELGVGRDERGLYTFKALTAGQTSIGVEPARLQQLDALVEHHRKLGNAALKKLKERCVEWASGGSFPTYLQTPCYAATQAPPPPKSENYTAL